jgi:hypothetical protein
MASKKQVPRQSRDLHWRAGSRYRETEREGNVEVGTGALTGVAGVDRAVTGAPGPTSR